MNTNISYFGTPGASLNPSLQQKEAWAVETTQRMWILSTTPAFDVVPTPSASESRGPLTHATLLAASQAGEGFDAQYKMLAVALAYAAAGIPVIPLWHVLPDGSCACGAVGHRPVVEVGLSKAAVEAAHKAASAIGKHPRSRKGVSEATLSTGVIRSWWWAWPSAGVGLATEARLTVIDIDLPESVRVVADLVAARRLPVPIAAVSTGRTGGVHIYVDGEAAAACGLRTGTKVLPGVDVRAQGGYVVAPPTMHAKMRQYAVLPFGQGLPEGDAAVGLALPEQRWEVPRAVLPGVTPAHRAWVAKRLQGQTEKVIKATPGDRHNRTHNAGVAMGAYIREGMVDGPEVRRSLIGAAISNGVSQFDAERAVERGLAVGMLLPIAKITDKVGPSAAAVVAAARAWTVTPEAKVRVGDPRAWQTTLTVLTWIVSQVEKSGKTTVRCAVRDLAIVGVTKNTGSKALSRLVAAGVLVKVMEGSARNRKATLFRLTLLKCWREDTPLTKSFSPYGRVSSLQHLFPILGHDVWGWSRGQGRGLTLTDRRLLATLPSDRSEIATSAWAVSAQVVRGTVSEALKTTNKFSLAGLGLVVRSRHGWAQATAEGALVIAVLIGGSDSVDALDGLAANLGVAGRESRRHEAVAADRWAFGDFSLGRVVAEAVRGEQPADDARRLVAAHLGGRAAEALGGLLAGLDDLVGARAVRRAVDRLLVAFGRGLRPSDADLAVVIVNDLAGLVATVVGGLLHRAALVFDDVTGEVLEGMALVREAAHEGVAALVFASSPAVSRTAPLNVWWAERIAA